jgi:transcriptional regulator with XRE-family HTH domain
MDWPNVIKELTASGLSQRAIADHCRVSPASVSELKTGAANEPRYSFGKALVDLYEAHVRPRPRARRSRR